MGYKISNDFIEKVSFLSYTELPILNLKIMWHVQRQNLVSLYVLTDIIGKTV